jgi:hypothetical protein
VRYQHGVFNKVAAARRCGTSKTTMYGNLLIGHAFLDGFIVL